MSTFPFRPPSALAALLPALLLGLTGCPDSGPPLVGAVLPLTGEMEIYGTEIENGIELAFEQLAGPAESRTAVLRIVDSKSDPEEAARALDALYEEGARAVIGGVTTAEAMAMVEGADRHGRVLLSPSASSPALTNISRNFNRVWPSDTKEGSEMGKHAAGVCRETAVVLAAEVDYARGVHTVFEESFENEGGQVVETILYPPSTDLGPLVERAVTLKPDCVYLVDYAEAVGRMIRLLREARYPGQILTVSAFASPRAITAEGEAAERVYLTHPHFDPEDTENPLVAPFVEAYRERFGEIPGIFAAHGYDAYLLLARALEENPSARHLWVTIRGLREVPGVTGFLQLGNAGEVAAKFPRVSFILESKLVDYEKWRLERIEELEGELGSIKNAKQDLGDAP